MNHRLLLGLLLTQTAALAAQDNPVAVVVSGPRAGDRAPDFSLPWSSRDVTGGDPWFSLSAHRGSVVVLAFYPRDFSSGCTAEMQTFTDQYAELFGEDVVVAGISTDSLSTHRRFAQQLGIPFRLLSDADLAVSKRYGSADPGGFSKRTVYVIDRGGSVAYADRQFGALDPKAYERLKDAVQAARREGAGR
jgi:peroxiredoxin Q/BCP